MANAAEMEKMKIAVASSDKTAKASVSNEAAKCPYILYLTSKAN